MNYQLAKNTSLNLDKKDLIQKLIAKNLNDTKITCMGNGGGTSCNPY